MDQWKHLITAGNRYFQQQEYGAAAVQYVLAKGLARQLLRNWLNTEEAVAAVVISQQNMADLYCLQLQPQQAEQELRDLYSYLLQELQKIEDEERGLAICNGLRRTYTALLSHIQDYGSAGGPALPPTQAWKAGTVMTTSNSLN